MGDWDGIQEFTKEGKCIQLFGSFGSGKGECHMITSVCIVDDKLYFVGMVKWVRNFVLSCR